MKKLLTLRNAKADHHNLFTGRNHPGDGAHVNGGEGNDWISIAKGSNVLRGYGGYDYLAGGDGNDELYGGDGNDELKGRDGNDELTGGAGEDWLNGGAGADTFIFAPGDSRDRGGDIIESFAPDAGDRIELRGFSSDNLTISDLINATGSAIWLNDNFRAVEFSYGDGREDDRIITLPDGGKITLLNVADVPLSAIRIAGFTIREVAAGGADDTDDPPATGFRYDGGAGNDRRDGGPGNDDLRGYDGDDVLNGGAGDDKLDGGAGIDVLDGGDGNDELDGGDGNDLLDGGDGSDLLDGGAGIDVLGGGNGNDDLRGNGGYDELYGEAGDDLLDGGDGNDTLYGDNGDDDLTGGAGEDWLNGGAGADTFIFAPGDSRDRVGDIIENFAPDEGDRIELRGFSSDNLTISDLIDATGSAIWLNENFRAVEFTYGDGREDDRIITLPDGGKITLLNVADVPLSAIRIAGFTIREVAAGGADDTDDPPATGFRYDGGAGNDRRDGGPGNDDLRGYDGNDVLNGGAGNDRLAGMAGTDELNGGPGDDTSFGGTGNDRQTGGDGNDRLYGGHGDDQQEGGRGNDRLSGGAGDDELNGNDGDDTGYGGTGDDELRGGDGDDRLYGGPGDDDIWGGAGDDFISGGPGEDQLTGGAGIDIFRFVPGHSTGGGDVILDYTAGDDFNTSDKLDLTAFNIDPEQDLAAQGLIVDVSRDADGDGDFDDTIITLPDGGIINVLNDSAYSEIWAIYEWAS